MSEIAQISCAVVDCDAQKWHHANMPFSELQVLENGTYIGYMRALSRGADLTQQALILASFGVQAKFVYEDGLSTARTKIGARRMFAEALRALRRGDILVVPSLGIFGRNRKEIVDGMAALELRGVGFVSVTDDIDTRKADPEQLFKLSRALHHADNLWRCERTENATRASRLSGRSGRRPKLSARREHEAMTAWLDPENSKTNAELGAEFGLSASRLHAKFGARGRG